MLFSRIRNIKICILALGLFVATSSSFAVLISPFTSWDDLSKKSPDIVIARCIDTPEQTIVINGMIWSNIEVMSVIKGDTQEGAARMVSQYVPCHGEQFLLFATYESNKEYRAYNATETYRVVPLDEQFRINELAGKNLHKKIILTLRHKQNK
nr:hypothetical protein [uncultured Undibacterium sp.]